MKSVCAFTMFLEIFCMAFVYMNLFDLIICNLFTRKEIYFFHFNNSFRNIIFPFFHFTFINKLICLSVSHIKCPFSWNLVVHCFPIPLVDESWIDFFQFSFSSKNLLGQYQTKIDIRTVRMRLTLRLHLWNHFLALKNKRRNWYGKWN